MALRASNEDITQELHLDFFEARALAVLTLSGLGIKTEMPRGEIAIKGFFGSRKEISDGVKGPDVNRRIGARGASNRGLVHEDGFMDAFLTAQSSH